MCAHCGGPLSTEPQDEGAMWKEHDKNFPGMARENAVRICDDCYQRCTLEYSPKKWMKDRKKRK